MQLPEQIRNQVEQANQHYRELENPEPVKTDPAPQAEETPAEDPAPAEQPAAPAVEPPQEPEQDATYWRHRFQTLQGKYNAEVPALSSRVRELEAEAARRKERAAAPTAKEALDAINQLSDEQLSEFGPETLAMVETLIQRRIGQAPQPDPELAAKLERLEQAEQRRQEEQQQDSEARFWSTLHARIPNLQDVNADGAFHRWLAQYDPMSGVQRQQALAQAQQALDAGRVVAVFNAFFQETGAVPAKKREVPEEAIQPSQSRNTNAPAEEKVWTGDEITRFYQDKARGKYSREEADRIEADIFAATATGRVR